MLIACSIDAREVATAEEARPRFPPALKAMATRLVIPSSRWAAPYINRSAQRRIGNFASARLRRCGLRTTAANGTRMGVVDIIDVDSCGEGFASEFGNAEAGGRTRLEASCRADAFLSGRSRTARKRPLHLSTRPRVRFRSDGPDGSTGTADPAGQTLKRSEAEATPGRREEPPPQASLPTALASLAPPLAICEESSEVVSLVLYLVSHIFGALLVAVHARSADPRPALDLFRLIRCSGRCVKEWLGVVPPLVICCFSVVASYFDPLQCLGDDWVVAEAELLIRHTAALRTAGEETPHPSLLH